jgi:hypothetical protein
MSTAHKSQGEKKSTMRRAAPRVKALVSTIAGAFTEKDGGTKFIVGSWAPPFCC